MHGPLEPFSEAHLFNVAAHAAVGCASSVVSGGKCGPGALSGAVPSFAGPFIQDLNFQGKLVANTVLGGVASVAAGGKFENGAITGAFGYLFNQAALLRAGPLRWLGEFGAEADIAAARVPPVPPGMTRGEMGDLFK